MLWISGARPEETQWRSSLAWPCCPELVGEACSRLVSRTSGAAWGPASMWCGETTPAEQRLCDDLDRRPGCPQHPDQDSPAETGACFSVPNFWRPASTTPKIHDPDPLEAQGGVSTKSCDTRRTAQGKREIQRAATGSKSAARCPADLNRARPHREAPVLIRARFRHSPVEPTKDCVSPSRGV
jgi:hypothetical protein